ncbi:acyl-CoA/acyl-ACP dehydrogenase [Novosphingobium sp. KCTC 2891]|uniref:acyl-CoA/acyl-ACP dehydrogenase n=1 Tax=Novosphingobium sp. KCTC 2891 TaxID=2989730 RepID=UPI002221A091|nr:acyl-CoA/acyl-ACP dehydrogenase [Novosphingobium sp. KCTC 2891]MCW1383633.1 acyl-CoA/acyl-ACP dehydrogenase [Novosphingobium sp. KCTC 2891]
MDLSLDSQQEALVAATADWCRDNMPLEQARNRPDTLWSALQAMGWTAMTGPDVALDHATEALVFVELGRHLAPVSLMSGAVAARWTDQPGKVALALFGNAGVRVCDAEGATIALGICDGVIATFRLPPGLVASPALDPTTTLARLAQPSVRTPVDSPLPALHLQLLTAAFAAGCADAARDMASSYAALREQFERPIGWFQAIKHMCADMAVRCAVARAQISFAACALDADAPDAAFHVAAARQVAEQAAMENARANIQVHGGIGMTDEASPHLCLKRAHLLSFIAPARRSVLLGDPA